jgi:hypothetical protein
MRIADARPYSPTPRVPCLGYSLHRVAIHRTTSPHLDSGFGVHCIQWMRARPPIFTRPCSAMTFSICRLRMDWNMSFSRPKTTPARASTRRPILASSLGLLLIGLSACVAGVGYDGGMDGSYGSGAIMWVRQEAPSTAQVHRAAMPTAELHRRVPCRQSRHVRIDTEG